MEKVVITGGAGFIGSNLAYFLANKGYEVTVVDNFSYGYEENLIRNGKKFCEIINKDIRDEDLTNVFVGKDFVFHLAAISSLPTCQLKPGDAISINVAGTSNVLEAARKANIKRVIFASTNALYENNLETPFREDMLVDPYLIYPISKYLAEQICRSFRRVYNMDIVITRYHNAYGPHQDTKRKSPPLTAYIIRELLAGKTPILHSDGKQKRDYVYIEDINNINFLCMTREEAKGETFNVASGKTYSVNEIYKKIATELDSKIKPVYNDAVKLWDSYPALFEGAYPLNKKILIEEVNKFTLGETKKAKLTLGWEAKISMDEGISMMVSTITASNKS